LDDVHDLDSIMIDVAWLNSLREEDAFEAFLTCCGARRWAEQLTARRPYVDETEIMTIAREVWHDLEAADWRQAFAAHPQIGEMPGPSSKTAAWSAGEQSGVANAADATRTALAAANRRYQEKFGWIFIICATGKSGDEILALLRQRLDNDPAEELRIAAAEQEKITLLRLHKLTPNRRRDTPRRTDFKSVPP
jgi:2-oxo-4-hydroxy-4-carboxy-5-ureidoimidazoline decarboxylase